MAQLLSNLPAPKQNAGALHDMSNETWFKERVQPALKTKHVPAYGKRTGFIPCRFEGGAFPEIHVLQLGCKEEKKNAKLLPVSIDASGGMTASKIVFSHPSDLVPKLPRDVAMANYNEEEIEETTQRTKMVLEKLIHARVSAMQPKNVPLHSSEASYIKYTPSHQSTAFNWGAKERLLHIMEMPKDPLEPPKFKHKCVPKASGLHPVPLMHSPLRPLTVKDQQDWKIPPCISNWKNPKGYTIPLDKRLAADGRGLQAVQINDNFAKLSEALYVSEQKSREEIEMRSKLQKELILKAREKKEQELRMLAHKARYERAGGGIVGDECGAPPSDSHTPAARKMDDLNDGVEKEGRVTETKEDKEACLKREEMREDRKRDWKRLEAKEGHVGKRSKITRDKDRDIGEKVALGMANIMTGQATYDQRLFNQDQGMQSGFATDDAYNIYDKGLYTSHSALSSLYQPKKDGNSEVYGGADEQVLKTNRFMADKGFAGATEQIGSRERPVEFEDEADPFGLNQFLTEVKKGKKGPSESWCRRNAPSKLRIGHERVV